ncbi:HTR7 (predicted) [Pycnogonum litorale]
MSSTVEHQNESWRQFNENLTLSTTQTTSSFANKRYDILSSTLVVFCLGLIIVATIIGNVLVCLSVVLVRKLRHPSNYLLMSLAVSDLGVAFLVMPLALYLEVNSEWHLGKTICDMWVSFDVYCCTASILNLCMISVDRYFAITNPLRYGMKRTPKLMFIFIASVWIMAALVSLPPLLILGNEHGNEGEICKVCQNFGYQLYATLGAFYIPLFVMIGTYHKIYAAAKKITNAEHRAQLHLKAVNAKATAYSNAKDSEINQNSRKSESTAIIKMQLIEDKNGESQKTLSSVTLTDGSAAFKRKASSSSANNLKKDKRHISLFKERKASITLGIIMSVFTICWLPFFVLALLLPISSLRVPDVVQSVFLWLGYTNSMLNPIIYATFHKDFRKPFKEILCLRCSSLKEMMREEYYQFQYGDPEKTPAPSPLRTSRNGSAYECQILSTKDSSIKSRCPPSNVHTF